MGSIGDDANMRLSWLTNDFICKELYAPFVVERDNDYLSDLKNRYEIVLNQAEKAGADDDRLCPKSCANVVPPVRGAVISSLP